VAFNVSSTLLPNALQPYIHIRGILDGHKFGVAPTALIPVAACSELEKTSPERRLQPPSPPLVLKSLNSLKHRMIVLLPVLFYPYSYAIQWPVKIGDTAIYCFPKHPERIDMHCGCNDII
jgi:hypothetical protein